MNVNIVVASVSFTTTDFAGDQEHHPNSITPPSAICKVSHCEGFPLHARTNSHCAHAKPLHTGSIGNFRERETITAEN